MARYPFPWDIFLRLAVSLPSGKADMVGDAQSMVQRMVPSPVVEGQEHVPRQGPLLVAVNHYQRRGLWIGWPGAVVTVEVARIRDGDPVHWLVTGGLRWCQPVGRGPEVPFSAALFDRVADAYGMMALPLRGPGARATRLLAWLRWLRSGAVCGIFPEGLSGRSGRLGAPEPGFDQLCGTLGRLNVPIVPCGVFEDGPAIHVRFGSRLPTGSDAASVMDAIGRLLPAEGRDTNVVALE